MRRRARTSAPAVARPAPAPASGAPARLPALGKLVSIGFEDVSLSWRTRVEVSSGNVVVLVAPTRALGDAIVPEIGREVLVGWAEDDGYYEAECTFESTGVDTVVTWVLTVHRVARTQRRSAFRIDTMAPVTVRIGDADVAARLRNISEGGLCCVLARSAMHDDVGTVGITAELGELGTFTCEGEVVRIGASAEPGEVEIGVAFTGLDEERVEDLRQFVFAEQLRRRRAMAGR